VLDAVLAITLSKKLMTTEWSFQETTEDDYLERLATASEEAPGSARRTRFTRVVDRCGFAENSRPETVWNALAARKIGDRALVQQVYDRLERWASLLRS